MSSIQASRHYSKAQLCLMEQMPEPCTLVIFGASGDLTFRKLIPSLFYLFQNNLLPKQIDIIGVARTVMSDQLFQRKVTAVLSQKHNKDIDRNFVRSFHYVSGDYSQSTTYKHLCQKLKSLHKGQVPRKNCLFYLSTPPHLYPIIIKQLGRAGLSQRSPAWPGWSRVIIEKPFGSDISSSRELNAIVHQVFQENQIYRIDHYLGKETVQNIMMFRFANTLFEPAWHRHYIDHVQLTAAEELGVEHRAGYYDKSGVLRDMFQNHLLQLMALITMEPPSRFEANSVRDKKVEIFRAIRPLIKEDLSRNVVLAQYQAGSIQKKPVRGYRDEDNVTPNSTTPTFAAMKLEIDNWRWKGVPFYLRSGKRMARRMTEITIQFKSVPTSIFQPLLADQLERNVLRFRLQPNEGVSISFESKHPGPKLCISTVTMDFDYEETFGKHPPESYARLLLDSMIGDQTLFARSDGVEATWELLEPALKSTLLKNSLHFYPAGSWGPRESDVLLSNQGRRWL